MGLQRVGHDLVTEQHIFSLVKPLGLSEPNEYLKSDVLLSWRLCEMSQYILSHRNFLEVRGWPSVSLTHPVANLPSHRGLWTRCQVLCIYALSCPALCGPMDCSPPSSSVHGIIPAKILEWVVISSSKRSSWPRDWTWVSCIYCIGWWILNRWAHWEAQWVL